MSPARKRAPGAAGKRAERRKEERRKVERRRAPSGKSGAKRTTAPAGPDVAALDRFLHSLGVDPSRDPEYTVTGALLAELLADHTRGLREEIPILHPLPYRGRPGEVVALEGIAFYGLCPHHLVPYIGEASVRFTPRDQICGAGALARLVRDLSNVPRLQENLTQALADAVGRFLEPRGIEVSVRARHLCMELRSPDSRGTHLVTEARRGEAIAPQSGSSRPERGPRR